MQSGVYFFMSPSISPAELEQLPKQTCSTLENDASGRAKLPILLIKHAVVVALEAQSQSIGFPAQQQ